ncbi:hypothetical protein FBU59_003068 [Linderina macrospora]|uniref:Uncharacterized protein n=1 Tax=Linderina macrospora TaxID=4868 RepID=A0ACC1J9G4_9FUNG|nr:hypothetical protein FBU59_003068 [Linderina macrospora]
MAGCDQRFFVVAYGDRYECIDTENTDNRAEYTTEEMYIFVRQTSESFASLKRKLEQAQLRKATFPNRLPNGQFKLSDYLGNEVIDGEEFRLTRDLENYHSYYSDEGRGDSNEDGRKPRYDGIVIVEDFMMLYPEDDAIFTSETIEGIVYLKYGEQYVYCPDDHDFAIELTQELPDKSERLHMEYDGNALIFSHWDKFGYAYEEFLDHKGYIDFAEGEDLCFGNDNMQLHIVKL